MEITNDIIKNNNLVLEKYANNAVRKRIKKEIDAMYSLFNEIIVSVDSSSNLKVIVVEYNNNKKQKYHFIIDNNYPFGYLIKRLCEHVEPKLDYEESILF
jgi:hypothetical protein